MEKEKLLDLLKDRILILDGAMGTQLMEKGFTKGCSDELNIKNPEIIKSVHKGYADAGCDIIITNTFGANKLKLSQYNLQNKLKEINEAAIRIAREAAPNCLIAGDIGPLGKYIEPLDSLTFEEAYDIYKEQVLSLNKADLLIIETISDIKTLKAAIIAAKENSDLPIIAQMTFESTQRTDTGTDVQTFTAIADSLGADVIGANCSEGPEGLLDVAKIITKSTNKPVIIQPNAGLPKIIGNKTVYTKTPEEFARQLKEIAKLGVNLLGGCCGTTPAYLKTVVDEIRSIKPIKRGNKLATRLCSRTKTVELENKTLIVGERINPTGKPKFQEELKQGKTLTIRNEALSQAKEGASLLDINIGVPGIDEPKTLKKAIAAVQVVADLPLVIDTSNPAALEEALKQSDGKPLINSVNADERSLKTVLPLAKKYGAAIIALAIEKKLPKTKEDRISAAKKIIQEAEKVGIQKQDIIVDCITTTIATNPENEQVILDSIKEIKKLGYRTILGISNISHGMPNRSKINSVFLNKASKAGLDLAILNPLDNIILDETELGFLKEQKIGIDYSRLPIKKQLYNAVLYGDEDNILDIINRLLEKLKALEINGILIKALEEVGAKFKKKEYYLPNVLSSARAMSIAFKRLKKEFKKEGGKPKATLLFATVENDIHDIGKNIVTALLESHNYRIIDLGKDVKKEKIIEEAIKNKVALIGLSALMTTTAPEMEDIIKELKKRNINIPVLVGGAVITEDYANIIRADYAKDALGAVKKVEEILCQR